MVSSRRARLQQRAESGDDGARTRAGLSNDPNVFLATGQIGITLIGVLSGAFGGAALSKPVGGLLEQIPGLESSSETHRVHPRRARHHLSLAGRRRTRSETDRAQQPGRHRRPDRGPDAAAFPGRRPSRQSPGRFHGCSSCAYCACDKNDEPAVTEEEVGILLSRAPAPASFTRPSRR